MSENGAGFLDVGTNDKHEVVINLPRDMTGHIVFSVDQARALALSLQSKAFVAEVERMKAEQAERVANLPPVDRSALCTTDGRSPEAARASQTNETGQHPSYLVLCDAERAKGFVRPYRDRYKHAGRAVCGKIVGTEHGFRTICDDSPMHAGDCDGATRRVTAGEQVEIEKRGRVGGCGGVTTMGRALSETYARDPTFYGATFCVNCNRHLPVGEFVWTADGQVVGS